MKHKKTITRLIGIILLVATIILSYGSSFKHFTTDKGDLAVFDVPFFILNFVAYLLIMIAVYVVAVFFLKKLSEK